MNAKCYGVTMLVAVATIVLFVLDVALQAAPDVGGTVVTPPSLAGPVRDWESEGSSVSTIEKGSSEYFELIAGNTSISFFPGSRAFTGPQNVFLDFDSETNGGEHVYTVAERNAIQSLMAGHYGSFNYSFSQTVPTTGTFSTVIFNGDGPDGGGIGGGLASDIDFRNEDLSGTAWINLNDMIGGVGELADTSGSWIGFSSSVGTHELGHLSGLRHGDSFGPIGSGLPSSGTPGVSPYLPDYPGLETADETPRHNMASPASVGSFSADAVGTTYFSERSAVKLQFNQTGTVTDEQLAAHGSAATAQPLALPTISVPNLLTPLDDNFGLLLSADTEVITGSIGELGENDWYSFTGSANDLFNFEVISSIANRFVDPIDPEIRIFDTDGVTLLDYYGVDAYNDDEFESLDSIIVDLVLPTDGTFYVQVSETDFTGGASDTGSYELFGYRFNAASVPEPSSLVILLGAFVGAAGIRPICLRGRFPANS